MLVCIVRVLSLRVRSCERSALNNRASSLLCDCWKRFVHSRLLLVEQSNLCVFVDSVSHTDTYYSHNAHKPVARLLKAVRYSPFITHEIVKPIVRLLRALRALTLVTRTIHTRLLCDCWERFVHSRLLLVQYTQACCAIVESSSYTHGYFSYNTQACCTIVDSASHTYGYYSYNTHKTVVRLLRVLRTLTLITRTIQTTLFLDCLVLFVLSRLLTVQYSQAWCWFSESSWCSHA